MKVLLWKWKQGCFILLVVYSRHLCSFQHNVVKLTCETANLKSVYKEPALERRDEWNKDSWNVFRSVVNIVQPALCAFVLRFVSGALCFAHEWFGIHSLSTANVSIGASVEPQRWAINLSPLIESYHRASYTTGRRDPDKVKVKPMSETERSRMKEWGELCCDNIKQYCDSIDCSQFCYQCYFWLQLDNEHWNNIVYRRGLHVQC